MKGYIASIGSAVLVFGAAVAEDIGGQSAHQRHESQVQSQRQDHDGHDSHAKPQSQPQDHGGHQSHAQARPQPQDRSGHGDHAQPLNSAERTHHKLNQRDQPTESELRHVPPAPPQQPMHEMSNEEMIELMEMNDAAAFGMVLVDHLEWRESDALLWGAQAWYGTDYDKIWLKSEGERVADDHEGRTELLWDRIITRWWSIQAGIRHDFGAGPARTWSALGVQGLAPYWFEIEATVYAGEGGRSAARFSGEYELLITQRLVLQPQIELDFYGSSDVRNGIGTGLSQTTAGLRLRYELRREFAPYVGVVWERSHGHTADLARLAGRDANDLQMVMGLRAWF